MGPIQTVAELIAMLRRRKDLVAAVFGLGVLASLGLAVLQTPAYQSHAVLSARLNTVAEDFATGAGAQVSPVRLLQLVEQRLTTRENMLALAQKYDLFPKETPQMRVDLTRRSINLFSQEAVTVGHVRDGMLASIVVQARADSNEKAAAIANDLAEMILVETGAGREARVRETLNVLQERLAQVEADIANVQQEARSFDAEHPEALPFNVEMRRSELTQLTAAIQAAEGDVATLSAELETLLRQGSTQRRLTQLREELGAREAELQRLRARRTELEPFFMRLAGIERERALFTQREERLRETQSELREQINRARDTLRLETGQQIAAFELVEPAAPEDYPVSRSRRATAMMGIVASGLLALVAGFAYELLRPALRSAGQIERETGLRPVMELPALVLPSERRKVMVARLAGLGLFVLGVLAIAITWTGS
ncbi:MAG: hypothetical protein JJT99_08620 [Rhodobacteraceae bacterium]|nr:hypothetical protein [Paracoccaceae bacterium]